MYLEKKIYQNDEEIKRDIIIIFASTVGQYDNNGQLKGHDYCDISDHLQCTTLYLNSQISRTKVYDLMNELIKDGYRMVA